MSVITLVTQRQEITTGFFYADAWACVLFSDFTVLKDFENIRVRCTFMAKADTAGGEVRLYRGTTDLNIRDGTEITGGEGTLMQTVEIPNDDTWAQYEVPVTEFAHPGFVLHPITIANHVTATGVGNVHLRDVCLTVRGIDPLVGMPVVLGRMSPTFFSGGPYPAEVNYCQDLNVNKRPWFGMDFGGEDIDEATVTTSTIFLTDASDMGNTPLAATVGVGSIFPANVPWVRPDTGVDVSGIFTYRVHVTSGLLNTDGRPAIPTTWDVNILNCA